MSTDTIQVKGHTFAKEFVYGERGTFRLTGFFGYLGHHVTAEAMNEKGEKHFFTDDLLIPRGPTVHIWYQAIP